MTHVSRDRVVIREWDVSNVMISEVDSNRSKLEIHWKVVSGGPGKSVNSGHQSKQVQVKGQGEAGKLKDRGAGLWSLRFWGRGAARGPPQKGVMGCSRDTLLMGSIKSPWCCIVLALHLTIATMHHCCCC